MLVRCANCQTEFSLDDRQVGPDGASVRCSVCAYVFRVEAPSSREATWHIRTVEDLSFTSPDLPTLRQWIREGRLHPDDEVSRTGRHWLRLGDMPEFSGAFRGFGGLPEVFVEVAAESGGAMEELGPPPSFGSESQGEPVQAVVPEPSEIIHVGPPTDIEPGTVEKTIARPRPREESGPLEEDASMLPADLANVRGVPQAVHDDLPEARASLDDLEPTAVASLRGPITEAPQARREHDHAGPHPRADEIGGVDEVEDVEDIEELDEDPEAGIVTEIAKAKEAHPLEPTGAGSTAVVKRSDVLGDEPRRTILGVPKPLPRRSSSRPVVAADEDDNPPASMLDAVTAHVKPITRAAIEAEAESDQDEPDGEPAAELEVAEGSHPQASVAEEVREPSAASLSHAAAARRSPAPLERRNRSWPLWAGLGLLVGVAVIFGIPDIRNTVLGWAGIVAGPAEPGEPEVLTKARERTKLVLGGLDPAEVEDFRARLDEDIASTDDDAIKAKLELLRTEVLAAIVFESRIKAAIALQAALAAGEPMPVLADGPKKAGAELEAAMQALPTVAARADDPLAAARAEVRAAVARGIVPKSLGALGADAVATELQLSAIAAPWITEPKAKVPSGLIGGLAELSSPSATSSLLLALAYWRAGDETRAVAEANTLLARVPDQPTAKALVVAAQASQGTSNDGGDGAANGDGGGEDGDPAADGANAATDGGADPDDGEIIEVDDDDGGGDGPAQPRVGVDTLIERGCNKVEEGQTADGISMLLRAYDRRPRDVDAMTCLGEGYAKQGKTGTALTFYERVLDISPRFKPAVRGAAMMAEKLGRTSKALQYYERLLDLEPSHGRAKDYIAKHGGAGDGGGAGGGAGGGDDGDGDGGDGDDGGAAGDAAADEG